MPSPFMSMVCTSALLYEGQHRLCVLPAGHDDRTHHRDHRGLQWDRQWNNRMEIYDRMCAEAGWREEPPAPDAWTTALYRQYRDENGDRIAYPIDERTPVTVAVSATGAAGIVLDRHQPRTRSERRKKRH